MVKHIILVIGNTQYEHSELEKVHDISSLASIEYCTSQNRTEFLIDLQGKYKNITAIYRPFLSNKITGPFDEEIAINLPNSLKVIAQQTAGYDDITVEPFSKKGIQICNVTTPVYGPTADNCIYLMLGALRNFGQAEIHLRREQWVDGVDMGQDPEGKVLGIIGMGGIGRTVRDRAVVFGFKEIIYYNRSRLSEEDEKGSRYMGLYELMEKADVISLNCPLNPTTQHLINDESIGRMKDGVIIINTARGPIIDEEALVRGLESGKIGGVGLDVFENEPSIHPELMRNEKAVLLPHVGTRSIQARNSMEAFAIENIKSYLENGKVISLISEQKRAEASRSEQNR